MCIGYFFSKIVFTVAIQTVNEQVFDTYAEETLLFCNETSK